MRSSRQWERDREERREESRGEESRGEESRGSKLPRLDFVRRFLSWPKDPGTIIVLKPYCPSRNSAFQPCIAQSPSWLAKGTWHSACGERENEPHSPFGVPCVVVLLTATRTITRRDRQADGQPSREEDNNINNNEALIPHPPLSLSLSLSLSSLSLCVLTQNMSFPGKLVQRAWHLVDAESQTVGRLAVQIAPLLKGKHKPTYRPNADCGDYVVVVNADKVRSRDGSIHRNMHRGAIVCTYICICVCVCVCVFVHSSHCSVVG